MVSHFCDTCNAKFQRAEHLARHRLRHLGQRPFSCSVCGATFSRRDSLQRHMALHPESNGGSGKNDARKPSQSRVKQACLSCSRSKLRCNGENPCGRCKARATKCDYPNTTGEPRRGGDEGETQTTLSPSPPSSQRIPNPGPNTVSDTARFAHESRQSETTVPESERHGAPSSQDGGIIPGSLQISLQDSLQDSLQASLQDSLQNTLNRRTFSHLGMPDVPMRDTMAHDSAEAAIPASFDNILTGGAQQRLNGEPLVSPGPSHQSHQQQQQHQQFVSSELQTMDFDSFSALQESAVWDAPQYFGPVFQGPYLDFYPIDSYPLFASPQPTVSLSDMSLSQSPSDETAPPPSFCGASNSPEPQEGQPLSFNELLRETRSRQRFAAHATGGGNDSRDRDSHGTRSPCTAAAVNSAGKESGGGGISDQSTYASFMGTFPAELSAPDGGGYAWEAEDFGHVQPPPQKVYDEIVANFHALNSDSAHYSKFAEGSFPSLVACSAFMQLFFEAFNPFFPLLHQPTFDPSEQHWLLLLAVMATGCRFSRNPAVAEGVDLLQEFLRRAFNTVLERDYLASLQPWLAQAGLLSQIGMQFSKDLRLMEHAQSSRSLVATLCRKINCFVEPDRGQVQRLDGQDLTETWQLWARKESMRRLAYGLWLIDSQYVLYFDLPPIIPTDLLRVRMPCAENLWLAPTAWSWNDQITKIDFSLPPEARDRTPLFIRHELNHLYSTRTLRSELGDFSRLLLIMGVFRNTIQLRHSDVFDFHVSSAANSNAHNSGAGLNDHAALPSSEPKPETFPGTRMAIEYLRILWPENSDARRLSSPSLALESVIAHHYHSIIVLLGLPLRELFCFSGYRVTSVEISHCHNRLRLWVQHNGAEARRVAYHAGRLFGCIRNSSDMAAYYEGRALMIACLALWIYSEVVQQTATPTPAPTMGDGGTSGEDLALRQQQQQQPMRRGIEHRVGEQAPAGPSSIRLDRCMDEHGERSWIEDGADRRLYLAGAGNILGPGGISRLIHEGSRLLCASTNWPICDAMGKALRIFFKLRSSTNTVRPR